MMDIKKQLEIIAERANLRLQRWGIDGSISVSKGERTTTFWGWGSWARPTYIFKFGESEVGAYSDKGKIIRVKPNLYTCGRPYSMRCMDTYSRINLPFSIDFFLAVGALCMRLLKHRHVLFTLLEVEDETRIELIVARPKVRVMLQPDKATLKFEDSPYGFQQEGSIDDTLTRLNKIYALAGL